LSADGKQVRRLHALTALRFVAAAMIVVGHSPEVKMLPDNVGAPFVLFQAVSFFFVLSGFILTYVYPSLDTWDARKRFWQARFARVWPAHAATFFLILFLLRRPHRLGPLTSWWEGAWVGPANLALLHAWLPLPAHEFSFNSVSWSISTEFSFYLAFPFLIHRWARTWWWKLALAAALAAGMIALANVLHTPPFTGNNMRTLVSTSLVYVNPLARLFEFTLGMFAALAWKTLAGKSPHRILGTLLEAAAFALVLLNMYYAGGIGEAAARVPWLGEPAATWLVQGGVVALAFAVLVFVMALEWGWLSWLLGAPLGVLLGEISFSVYLLHQVLMRGYTLYFPNLTTAPRAIVYPIYWALLLLMSHLIWGGLERPLRRRLLAWTTPPDKPALQRALEKPAGKRHSLFNALLSPGPRVLLADALLAAGLIVFVLIAARLHGPPPK
jgi:peptidoglycan/LPS O-acetylase OafA/YrhL